MYFTRFFSSLTQPVSNILISEQTPKNILLAFTFLPCVHFSYFIPGWLQSTCFAYYLLQNYDRSLVRVQCGLQQLIRPHVLNIGGQIYCTWIIFSRMVTEWMGYDSRKLSLFSILWNNTYTKYSGCNEAKVKQHAASFTLQVLFVHLFNFIDVHASHVVPGSWYANVSCFSHLSCNCIQVVALTTNPCIAFITTNLKIEKFLVVRSIGIVV